MNKTINNILKWVDKEQCSPNIYTNISFPVHYKIDDRIYYTSLDINFEMASFEGKGYEADYWDFDHNGWRNMVDEDTKKKLDALLRKDMNKLLRNE